MEDKMLEKFRSIVCKNCDGKCYRGICDNGREYVCIDRNVHVDKKMLENNYERYKI